MDPETKALNTVVRAQLKSVRRQLSVLARLLAELEAKHLALETNGQPKEAHRDEHDEHER